MLNETNSTMNATHRVLTKTTKKTKTTTITTTRVERRPSQVQERKASDGKLSQLKRQSIVPDDKDMTANKLLYGRELSEYEELDVESLLNQLKPEDLEILSREVDPDDNYLPARERCGYVCEKDKTGPLNRKKLIEHINRQALETPDQPELVPFEPGKVRGKKWVPPPESAKIMKVDEEIRLDLGEEYEGNLGKATEDELVDLAAILGLHSMMNQEQYHASLTNKGQMGIGWSGVTKCAKYKPLPPEPINDSNVNAIIQQVKDNDANLVEINWNNINNISKEQFERLFNALQNNEHVQILNLCNVGLDDHLSSLLVKTLERNSTLCSVNLESNSLSPVAIRNLIKTYSLLGNQIETEIAQLVEQNPSLLSLGLNIEFPEIRRRVFKQLQRNRDKFRLGLKRKISRVPLNGLNKRRQV